MIVGVICGLWFQTEHYIFRVLLAMYFWKFFFFLNIAWNVFFNKLESIQKILLKHMMSGFYDRVSISAAIDMIIMVSYITCR